MFPLEFLNVLSYSPSWHIVLEKGVLDLCECDALLRMVYDVDDIAIIEGPPSGKELLAEMDVNGDGDVTIDEFGDLMDSHM